MRYRSLIVFRLGGWAPLLPTRFLVSRGTLDLPLYPHLRLHDFHILWQTFPDPSARLLSIIGVLNPARP